jgi:hypothetical protein
MEFRPLPPFVHFQALRLRHQPGSQGAGETAPSAQIVQTSCRHVPGLFGVEGVMSTGFARGAGCRRRALEHDPADDDSGMARNEISRSPPLAFPAPVVFLDPGSRPKQGLASKWSRHFGLETGICLDKVRGVDSRPTAAITPARISRVTTRRGARHPDFPRGKCSRMLDLKRLLCVAAATLH